MSIKLKHIQYVYGQGTAYEKQALKDVSLEIPQGQFLGIIGHTGSGKSTLIQHFNGLIKAASGELYYEGKNIYEDGYDMKYLRSQVGLVFQYPEHQLFEVDVLTDVCFGPVSYTHLFCFKELMQDEEVRNAFLAAVLGINLEEIVESRILPSHLRQKDKDDKLGILDVRVLLNNKEQIDIEIQVTSSEYWVERTLFYLGKMFVDQLKPGEDYQKLEKCIHVGILNFTLFDDEAVSYTHLDVYKRQP